MQKSAPVLVSFLAKCPKNELGAIPNVCDVLSHIIGIVLAPFRQPQPPASANPPPDATHSKFSYFPHLSQRHGPGSYKADKHRHGTTEPFVLPARSYSSCCSYRTQSGMHSPSRLDASLRNSRGKSSHISYGTISVFGKQQMTTSAKNSYGHPTLTPGIFTLCCQHGVCYGVEVLRSCKSLRHPFELFTSCFTSPLQ